MPGQTPGAYGARSDVYNIGVLAHEVLTGELPPPLLADHPLELPAELEAVVVSCLRESPADVTAVRDALLAIRAAVRPAATT